MTALLVAGTSFAQSGRPLRDALQFADENEAQQAPPQGTLRDGGDVVFSENFANGFAGNNGFGAWTTSGPNGNIWMRRTTGPVGAFTQATQIIAQPAPANGFMAFLSDSANCNCSSGAANWPATPTEWEGALESPVLDLSATPSVMLQWSQRLRWCCQATSPHAVEVSTDGGATWPTVLQAATGISTNQDPGTQTRQLMLTAAIAANPANVKFRFKHNPTAAAYHWQIDDVQLIELYDNDMKNDYAFFSHTGAGEEYGRIPADQLYSTMLVGADVTNNGAAEQTNVTVNVNVTGPTPFSTTINGGTVAPGTSATIDQAFALPTLAQGVYNGTTTVSADAPDQVPTNDQYLRNFEVNNTVYSLDGIGNHPTALQSLSTLGTASFTAGNDGLILLNYYQMRQPATVYGIEVGLGSTTVPGGAMIVSLRDTTPVFETVPNMTQVIAESDIVDVTAGMVTAGFARICFPNPVVLQPNGYFASATLFSNSAANHIRVVDDLTVPQPGITSAIYIPNDDVYSNGNAFHIRLLLSPAAPCNVGVGDLAGLEGVRMSYNPANNMVAIATDKAGAYSVEVIDLLGQTVHSTRATGSTQLSLAAYAKGVYSVRVSSTEGSTTQRFVVE
ncbi:MAG: T9SS type A sorting domain-containing protein [Flavobacteriales bacterium]|nr:T9SS type A sorting domain-containing protein [Flavobacteriales bacterium]